MMEKLWGDNFFDPATKKWTKKSTGAATCKRGFVQFIYEPIKTIIDACMSDNKVGSAQAEQKHLRSSPSAALVNGRRQCCRPGCVQHQASFTSALSPRKCSGLCV